MVKIIKDNSMILKWVFIASPTYVIGVIAVKLLFACLKK